MKIKTRRYWILTTGELPDAVTELGQLPRYGKVRGDHKGNNVFSTVRTWVWASRVVQLETWSE